MTDLIRVAATMGAKAAPPVGNVFGDTMDTSGEAAQSIPLNLWTPTGPEAAGASWEAIVSSGGVDPSPEVWTTGQGGNGGVSGTQSGRKAQLMPALSSADHWVEFQIAHLAASGVTGAGLRFDSSADNCFVCESRAALGANGLRMYQYVGAVLTKIGGNLNPGAGDWIRVEAIGNTVEIFIDSGTGYGAAVFSETIDVALASNTRTGFRSTASYAGADGLFAKFRTGPFPYVARPAEYD